MISAQKIPWLRIGTESVAIVVSILLAFSIDAWWQNRSEIRVEVQYLLALHDDLNTSLVLLDESEVTVRRQMAYLESLLQINDGAAASEELRLWIRDGLYVIGTYEPQLSSLRDLESSGQSRIIQFGPLRRALASVSQKLERLQAVQADFVLSQQMLLDPYLVDSIDLANVLRSDAASFEMDSSIFETKEFRSRVAFKLQLRDLVSQIQREIREAFVEAISLIELRLEQLN